MINSSGTVKRIREALNLNRTDFAEALQVSSTAILNYEKGIRCPKWTIVKKMQELAKKSGLELSADDFIN
jgi:DNA-binding XRE family transcriptional regulator